MERVLGSRVGEPSQSAAHSGIPLRVFVFLAIGLVAASQSGNIVRIADAPPVVMAAWRVLMASVVLALLARRQMLLLASLTGKELGLLLLAGSTLALHFIAWIVAVQSTSVANAAVLFSVNPVLTATAAFVLFGERIGWRLALAIALGFAGVVLMGAADFNWRPELWAGDLAALLCSAFYTVYLLSGKVLRRRLPTAAYTSAVYGVAAVVCLLIALVMGLELFAYSGRDWLGFVLLALVPTLIGHTSINYAVAYLKAAWVSTASISEALMAGLGAYLFWGELVSGSTLAGYALIAGGIGFLVQSSAKAQPGRKAA
jgi:drug/metabolite transporter (DMT)-like permease